VEPNFETYIQAVFNIDRSVQPVNKMPRRLLGLLGDRSVDGAGK